MRTFTVAPDERASRVFRAPCRRNLLPRVRGTLAISSALIHYY